MDQGRGRKRERETVTEIHVIFAQGAGDEDIDDKSFI